MFITLKCICIINMEYGQWYFPKTRMKNQRFVYCVYHVHTYTFYSQSLEIKYAQSFILKLVTRIHTQWIGGRAIYHNISFENL